MHIISIKIPRKDSKNKEEKQKIKLHLNIIKKDIKSNNQQVQEVHKI